jgi:hypothetical protein
MRGLRGIFGRKEKEVDPVDVELDERGNPVRVCDLPIRVQKAISHAKIPAHELDSDPVLFGIMLNCVRFLKINTTIKYAHSRPVPARLTYPTGALYVFALVLSFAFALLVLVCVCVHVCGVVRAVFESVCVCACLCVCVCVCVCIVSCVCMCV